jgi:hypothetical protein
MERAPEVNKVDDAFQTLKEHCKQRILKYIDEERKNSLAVKITKFFSQDYEDQKSISKKKVVKYLLDRIDNTILLDAVTAKDQLFNLSEIADMANNERFFALIRFDKANLAKAIEDVKGLIWTYIINYKPEMYQQLKQMQSSAVVDITRYTYGDTRYEVLGEKLTLPNNVYYKKLSIALYSEKAEKLLKQNEIDAEQKRLNESINQYRAKT